ncbi:MAG: tryptophan--tRNA ligase, partial [Syntrophobacteraceae bacterium]
ERMALYRSKPGLIDEIIRSGTLKMRQIAAETMREVRAKMGIGRLWESLRTREERETNEEDLKTPL